jgi:hypothetical protein
MSVDFDSERPADAIAAARVGIVAPDDKQC